MTRSWKTALVVGATITIASSVIAAINTAPPAQDTAITVYKTPT